jgi:carbon storage regulator
MLVLTRKINQSIEIGDDVRVIVVGIERDKVKLGVLAPPERAIRRSSTVRPSTTALHASAQDDEKRLRSG